MTESPNRRYVPEIDQLRGFAALLVLFYHGFQLIGARLTYGVAFNPTLHWVTANNPLVAVIEEGHSGVALFIVLSGFVLSLGTVGRQIRYGPFLLARILRLYPILILFGIAAYSLDRSDALLLLATILPFNSGHTLASGFTAMFWAVAVEFQCYLVFPFLILFSKTMGGRVLVQVIAVALLLRCLAVFAEGVTCPPFFGPRERRVCSINVHKGADDEETIYGRADYPGAEGAYGGSKSGGYMPEARRI